jgi:hypothetical protein
MMIGHYFFMVLPNRLWKVFEPPIEKPPRKGVDNPEDAPLTTGYCPTKSRFPFKGPSTREMET